MDDINDWLGRQGAYRIMEKKGTESRFDPENGTIYIDSRLKRDAKIAITLHECGHGTFLRTSVGVGASVCRSRAL